VVEEKTRCYVSGVVEGRHGFDPFGKVINCDEDVLVPIVRWRVESHEFNTPFAKGFGSDDGM
jgi:hypothetical protein